MSVDAKARIDAALKEMQGLLDSCSCDGAFCVSVGCGTIKRLMVMLGGDPIVRVGERDGFAVFGRSSQAKAPPVP